MMRIDRTNVVAPRSHARAVGSCLWDLLRPISTAQSLLIISACWKSVALFTRNRRSYVVTMSEDTVSFDIGGRIFRVRRSLLESFPTTIIARSASEEWHKKESDQPKPIFIDRDAGRFRYCLDYMRNGRVKLPHTESKAALLEDMEYYGFEDLDPGVIAIDFPAAEAFESLFLFDKNTQADIDAADLRLEHMRLARFCFDQYKAQGLKSMLSNGTSVFTVNSSQFRINARINTNLLNECLEQYGLRYDSSSQQYSNSFCVARLPKTDTNTD